MKNKHGAKWGGGLAHTGASHSRHDDVASFVNRFVLEEGKVEGSEVVMAVVMMVSGLGRGGQRQKRRENDREKGREN